MNKTVAHIQFRTANSLWSHTLERKVKDFPDTRSNLPCADDVEMIAHTEEDMKAVIDLFSRAGITFLHTISLKKTKFMLNSPPDQLYDEQKKFPRYKAGHVLFVFFVYQPNVTIKVRFRFYETLFLSVLYCSKTRTIYHHHMNHLKRFHQVCVVRILKSNSSLKHLALLFPSQSIHSILRYFSYTIRGGGLVTLSGWTLVYLSN